MIIYKLNSTTYSRSAFLTEYDSIIWTDRYSGFSEFEIKTYNTQDAREFFAPGSILSHEKSDQVMISESCNTAADENDRDVLTAKGISIEGFLKYRVLPVDDFEKGWRYRSRASDAMARMMREAVEPGSVRYANDAIPDSLVRVASIAGGDTSDVVWRSLPPQSVYDAVSDLGEFYNLAFRCRLADNSPRLRWEVYRGAETNVVFNPSYGNVSQVEHVNSEEDWYNVASLWTKGMTSPMFVFGAGSGTGYRRRVLNVDVSDIDASKTTGDELSEVLLSRGQEELAKYKKSVLVDGLLTDDSIYKYLTDYSLGDIVTFQDRNTTTRKRVVEYIWASDAEGDRSYPAFADAT